MPLRRDFGGEDGNAEYARAWASERLGAVAHDLAHPVAVFYLGLIREGLSEQQAERVTGQFIAILLRDTK